MNDEMQNWRALGRCAYPYLVAKLFNIGLRKLLALAQLFDPAIDFVFHV